MTSTKKGLEQLQMKDLNFAFGEKSILKNVNLDLPVGKVVWIHGASGSGKSVFAKILSGLMQSSSGDYVINGESVNQMSFEEFLPLRMNIGYSFDFGGLINNRTILQNLKLPLEYHRAVSTEEADALVAEMSEMFNLGSVLHERPATIPGAFRKAACVARAFIMNPEMMVLDDPTTGLRGELKKKLKELIRRRRHEGTLKHVFIVTEDHEFVGDLFDEVILVKNNSIELFDYEKWRQNHAS